LFFAMPPARYLSRHGHVVGGHRELGLIVGLAGNAGVDRGEQRIDVRFQLLGDCIGGQFGDHGVDQLAERGPVGIQVGLGLGDLLVVLGGLAQRVVDEESDVLPPGSEERLLGVGVDRSDRLRQRDRVGVKRLDCTDHLRILQIAVLLDRGVQRIARQPHVIGQQAGQGRTQRGRLCCLGGC
jgi:hypothetical protein